ncbi:MAG: phage capsid protein [Ruminococcus sp.]|uniref:phage minor capsid protein n=1 Tax=Ruminococcus sp. TaxID=41978 RepID=UPI0025D8F11B|nr:phage minor capsid protein [Ruminococcus sp.]MBD9048909.1 phage capsid protein [Ruminococcus sp.]
MLTPEQLAHCADDILELYSKLEEAIVRDIARRVAKTGTMTDTAIWQAQHMQELGTLNSDILNSISKYSGKCESELKKLFEDAAITATEYDNEIYRANGLNPKSIKVSDTQLQILEAGYKKTQGNLSNLTLTTAVSSQTSFINACSLAELKATSGAFSPQQAIVDAIKQVAVNGAEVIYPSGHTDKLDVAVRRNVMTGIGQTTGQICLANARELGCDLMEITAHAGARPSHSYWQGQVVSLSGRKGYLSLSDIGYGSGDGFKGWNCRHDWYPYFGGTRMYDEEKLKQMDAKNIEYPDGSMHTLYEAEQKQRAYERKIRESKRILAAYDESIKNADDEAIKKAYQNIFNKESVKLKRREAELNNFCDKTGLLKRNDRVQKYGFGRSTAQKAVQANKKAVAKSKNNSIIKLQINYFSPSDPLYVEAFSMEEEEGFVNICMHGSPQSVQRLIDGVPTNFTASEFAELLKNNKKYNGEDLKLLSCSTGKGDNSFAQQLSKELGIRVKAPDDDVYYAVEEGVAFVGASYGNTGKWRIFENGVEIFE